MRTDPVTGEGPEPERAIRELAAADWDFLIANVINWIDVRGVMRVLLAFRDRPIVLYSFGGFTEDGHADLPRGGRVHGASASPWSAWASGSSTCSMPPTRPWT